MIAARTRLSWLSPREREVLAMLCDGRTVAEIADASYVTVHTVRTQIHSMKQKLGVRTALAAVALANRQMWQCDEERRAALERVLAV